jgi:hypothetical protein
MRARVTNNPRWLLWAVIATYSISYGYLAVFHGEWWLWDTVVHEGGTHTLLWTTLYASHFLGHIPSLTVIAIVFAGFALPYGSARPVIKRSSALIFSLAGLILVSLIISGSKFGWSETLEFVLQQRQSVGRMEAGGSWLLHLPNTVLLFALIPLYLYFVGWFFGRTAYGRVSVRRLALAGVLVIVITILVTGSPIAALVTAFTDPRYLAHAVRELATFPLTFFPIPLYFLYRQSAASAKRGGPMSAGNKWILLGSALVFVPVFVYMMVIPLQAGIGELAQSPSFADGGRLSTAYLLTSHYFEHFLDTIYFTLICLLLWNWKGRDF